MLLGLDNFINSSYIYKRVNKTMQNQSDGAKMFCDKHLGRLYFVGNPDWPPCAVGGVGGIAGDEISQYVLIADDGFVLNVG